MTIQVDELQKLVTAILIKAQKAGIKEMDIKEDCYWYITGQEITNFSKEPTVAVGSFKEDLEGLKKILHEHESPQILDFERVGNLLILLGEKISTSDIPY